MFYTYLWLREDRTPYYVGKGKENRAYVDHWTNGRVRRVPSKELIVIYPAESEADAFETEIALIWYYGRKDLGLGCLRNLSDGGEGPSGTVASKESLVRRSEAHKGVPWTKAKRVSNNNQPRRVPTCHPNRKHKSEGLCKPCAYRAWAIRTGRMTGTGKVIVVPTCHPELEHRALGLCKSCYDKRQFKKSKERRGKYWRKDSE